ncbi:Zinc finger CCHC domain-containing protein 8 [Coemansia biformis]|uniref:Zinc finger CCHC domain-containing protein 8 n=1 Tax=Coemansia biformis TaxID=1286918 RepID=A0A9W7YCD6_9FUNG|nr:Zinc finger CCHC domain-containing protein 8 [Coemansia biformis]
MSDGEAGSADDASGPDAARSQTPSADSDLLLRLRFGASVSDDIRQRIVRYARRLLRRDSAPTPERRGADGRGRLRHCDAYPANGYRGSGDARASRKRRRGCADSDASDGHETDRAGLQSGAAEPRDAPGRAQSVALYSRAAGFDLDTTRGDVSDAEVTYEHGTLAVVGLTADSQQALGNPCFNCALPGHELRDCPMPVDDRRVDASRRAFREKGSGQFSGRFYLAAEDEKRMDELRKSLRPGQPLSQGLRLALGLKRECDVPEYIDSMYRYGYPPAYLGHDPGQDPLRTRTAVAPQVPPTPSLRVYRDIDDFDRAHRIGRTDGAGNIGDKDDPRVDELAGVRSNDEESGEEGAVSEGELSAEENGPANGGCSPAPARNIPLVQYSGLDLSEFDFSSTEHPGRPLRPYTPRYHTRADYRSPHFDGRYADSGRRRQDRNNYGQHDYYQAFHSEPSMAGSTYDDGWGGMLANYYNSAGRGGYGTPSRADRPQDSIGRSAAPSPLDVQRDGRPSTMTVSQAARGDQALYGSPQLATARDAASDTPAKTEYVPGAQDVPDAPAPPPAALSTTGATGAADCDGELEDGECDMEVSE